MRMQHKLKNGTTIEAFSTGIDGFAFMNVTMNGHQACHPICRDDQGNIFFEVEREKIVIPIEGDYQI